MLEKHQIEKIADDLAAAEDSRTMIPLLTAQYPDMEVEDSYAVQNEWKRRGIASGRKLIGRKIGLTSRVMQEATGITEPDYGAIFADQVYENGSEIEHDRFSNVRIEVELAFVLKDDLKGPDVTIFDVLRATEYVVPALEILSSRIEMKGRTIVDTISDNAALGAMVYGGARLPLMLLTCAGSPPCSTATTPSRKPVWQLPSSTTLQPVSPGLPTNWPATVTSFPQEISSSPVPSPARCGYTPAIPSMQISAN